MEKLLGSYQNGNYSVRIFSDGTKIRENDLDFFEAEFPENIDIKITNNCNIGCRFCFTPETQVNTDVGLKSIENVFCDDKVFSFNEKIGSKEIMSVTKKYERDYSGEIIKIDFDDFYIECTPNHKFLTLNRGWIEASQLEEGDDLVEI
jgi:intein/homing endonuclease